MTKKELLKAIEKLENQGEITGLVIGDTGRVLLKADRVEFSESRNNDKFYFYTYVNEKTCSTSQISLGRNIEKYDISTKKVEYRSYTEYHLILRSKKDDLYYKIRAEKWAENWQELIN